MNRESGFTLLEVLLAITLASLILTGVYSVFSITSQSKERAESQTQALHLARVLTSRLDRELLGLAFNGTAGRAVISGGVNSRGENRLELLTHSSGGPQPGLRRVIYRLGDDEEKRKTLWRAEQGAFEQEDIYEQRFALGFKQISFSFYDGQNWQDSWDSYSDGRPVLVRAEIELAEAAQLPPQIGVFEVPQKGRAR